MWANPLNPGDTIGIISPSHTVTPDDYAKIISGIEAKGFRVKTGSRLYRHTYGYAASETERADDLNEMVSDKDVKLVLFGGGYGSIELLPYIDYEAIRRHPKLFSSHSDGTSILNAIYTKTGLVTYYGLPPRLFEDIDAYAYEQFSSHLVRRDAVHFVSNSTWYSLKDGICSGTLIGGYTLNFALSLHSGYLASSCLAGWNVSAGNTASRSRTAMISATEKITPSCQLAAALCWIRKIRHCGFSLHNWQQKGRSAQDLPFCCIAKSDYLFISFNPYSESRIQNLE